MIRFDRFFTVYSPCPEVGKVTLKINGDEALSDESVQKKNGEKALNDDFS